MSISVYVCGSSFLKFVPGAVHMHLPSFLKRMVMLLSSLFPTVHVRSVPGYRRSSSLSVVTMCLWIWGSTREKRHSPNSPPEWPSSNKNSKIRRRYIYTVCCLVCKPLILSVRPCVKVLGQTSELLRASQERVRGGESSLEQTQRRLSKMEAAFKATSQEVLKVQCNLCTLVVCQTRVF